MLMLPAGTLIILIIGTTVSRTVVLPVITKGTAVATGAAVAATGTVEVPFALRSLLGRATFPSLPGSTRFSRL